MSYTAPTYVDTKAQAILALASTIADEDKTLLGDGSVNKALDVLADVLAEHDVSVPQTDAGAILALAQYVGGGGGGGGDFSTATVTLTLPNANELYVGLVGIIDDEFSGAVNVHGSAEIPFVMYKGAAMIDVVLSEVGDPDNFTFSSSGDIEPVTEPGSYIATGDCAITITVK